MSFTPIHALRLFSYGAKQKDFLVLKAYFDDSGTHLASDVVVMGGLIASEESWNALEPTWDAHLRYLGIKKMHMSHCEKGRKEFWGWERPKIDDCIATFREMIEKTHGRMLASAVGRKDWEDACAVTCLGDIFSDPLDFLFNTAMRRALESRRASAENSKEITVIFDSRGQNLAFWQNLAANYQRKWPNRMAGFSFGLMEKIFPLQAADMIAYESFVHQCARVNGQPEPPFRPNMQKLSEALSLSAGYYTLESLIEYGRAIEAEASGPSGD